MSEHEKRKQIELADGVGDAIEALVARAVETEQMIWVGDAVEQIRSDLPKVETSPAELAEAIIRAAAARGLAVAVQKVE